MDVPHQLDTQLGKGWEDRVLTIYCDGGSDAEVARNLGITMAVFDSLYQSYPLFEEYVNKGRSDARAWYEDVGRRGLIKSNGDLNHQLWMIIMKNRFGYVTGDRDEDPSKKPTGAMSNEELDAKIAAKFKEVQAITASRNPG